MGALVQRAVLVELWRKIVHAALGFPAFAHPSSTPSPVYPLCSRRPSAVWKQLGAIFQPETGEAVDLMKRTAGITGREIQR